MKEQEILNKAIETYGEESQIDMAIEECSELIQALCKYKRYIKAVDIVVVNQTVSDVYSEVADVQIMMKQLNIIFSKIDIDQMEQYKLERLERRLNEFKK